MKLSPLDELDAAIFDFIAEVEPISAWAVWQEVGQLYSQEYIEERIIQMLRKGYLIEYPAIPGWVQLDDISDIARKALEQ